MKQAEQDLISKFEAEKSEMSAQIEDLRVDARKAEEKIKELKDHLELNSEGFS